MLMDIIVRHWLVRRFCVLPTPYSFSREAMWLGRLPMGPSNVGKGGCPSVIHRALSVPEEISPREKADVSPKSKGAAPRASVLSWVKNDVPDTTCCCPCTNVGGMQFKHLPT